LGRAVANAHRVGGPLQRDVTGSHAARVRSHRVVDETDESERMITVLDIDHRADIHRTR
jgi:hypothetical protein